VEEVPGGVHCLPPVSARGWVNGSRCTPSRAAGEEEKSEKEAEDLGLSDGEK